jgi:hypothetical protein
MLPQCVVDEIRNLLATGLSYRKIALTTGVSRGSIGAIANGRRVDRVSREDEDSRRPCGPLTRCPTCGGMVCLPCLLCGTRATIGKKRPRKTPAELPPEESLTLALDEEHRQRYESIRFHGNAGGQGFRSPNCIGRNY